MYLYRLMQKPVFLDYNSTTPVDARVLEAMLPYFSEKFGNAASKTHPFGWVAEEAVKNARDTIASFINCTPHEVIFTSGSTESINLALKGAYEAYRSKGNHIITVSTEHKAVLDTCRVLEKKDAEVTYLPVDREGLIDLDQLEASICDRTILVAVMMANNETGVIQPMKAISEIAHQKKCILFSDTTQAAGKIHLDVQAEGIDICCLSAHKMYGPKGSGSLFVRRKDPRVSLVPQTNGGGHEKGLRSGTLNVPGIVGLGKACEIAASESWNYAERTSRLRTLLEQSLAADNAAFINGSIRNRLPNTTNMSFPGIKADELILKVKSIAVATGSACTSAVPEPSHVLKAMGVRDEMAYASVRFSLGKYTTEEEVEFSVDTFKKAVSELRKKQ